jgi:p-methyltransferase
LKKIIGIIAPLIDDAQQFHCDFNLRLRLNNRELTLAALYEFAQKGYVADQVSRGIDHEEDIPAAGYYLEGLLHQYGYETMLTNKYDAETLETIAGQDPIAVLVSTTMVVTTDSLRDLFSRIRGAMPDTVIIAGGVFVWKNYLLYQKYLKSDPLSPLPPWMLFHPDHAGINADILVVAQHGRSSLLKVLEEVEKGERASFEDIPNLSLPSKTGFTFTKQEAEQVDYNVDYTRWDLISKMAGKIPLRTSIGCPFRCRFCDFYHLYPQTFVRSVKSLGEELKLIKERAGHTPVIIHVSDDNVFITKKRLEEVCNAIADSGLRKWIAFMRAGEYSDIELDLMKRSGLTMGLMGIESGDQGQLERMNKHQVVGNVKRGIEQLDANGISTLMTFVVGFPGENAQTLENTANFLNGLSLPILSSSYQLYPLLVQPLSELADASTRAKWKIEGFMGKWSHYTMNSEEASKACNSLFREITNLPYHYFEESIFFNRAKFNLATKRSLFQLRHRLTIRLMEHAAWDQIEPILRDIAWQMKVPVDNIDESVRDQILYAGTVPFQ